MTRCNGFRTLGFSGFSTFSILLLAILCGCGGVDSGGNNNNQGPSQAVIAIAVAPDTIIQGQSSTLSWQVTNAASFSISPAVGSGTLPMSGSASVSPQTTTTYTATAADANGRQATRTVTLNVVPASSAPTVTMSISPPIVAAGQTATLTWASTNTTSLSITPSILGDDQTTVALSGSVTIVPTAATTYVATATGAGGVTARASAAVNILSVALTANPTKIGPGQSATLNWTSSNATSLSIDQGIGTVNGPDGNIAVSPAATTIYTITATNGTATATATATVNAPLAVTLKATPPNIAPGGQSTLTWASQGAASLSIDNGVGAENPPSGSVSVSPAADTTYTITATDGQGNTTTAAATVSIGTNSGLQGIKHIIVILQENRTFDSYFAKLGDYAASRGIANYQINAGYDPTILLPLSGGGTGHLFHEPTVRTENLSPSWNESHFDIDKQSDGTFKMDRFALTTHSVPVKFDPSGLRALGQYDQTDLPYYYELATQFATSDSFHSPLLANTVPNRQYAFCATSQGRIFPSPAGSPQWTCPTIFSSLQNANVKWAYYYKDAIFLASFTDWNNPAIQSKTAPIQKYFDILASPTADQDLPSVIWIDPGFGGSGLDEHPENNIQQGAAFIKTLIDALMNSPAWSDSVFILSYDEGGGLYDHVGPFTVVPPDDIPPQLRPGDATGDNFTLSGFRVPIIVVSPLVKPHFVSHVNRETTSILKLIETRFSLPALTRRDAAADDMTEFFDFVNPPAFLTPPPLPAQPTNGLDNQSKEAPPQ
jgi:phospholipase C